MQDKLRIVLKTVAVVLFTLGLVIVLLHAVKNKMRQNVSNDAIEVAESIIEEGGDESEVTVLVPKTGFLAVDGEAGEDDASLAEL